MGTHSYRRHRAVADAAVAACLRIRVPAVRLAARGFSLRSRPGGGLRCLEWLADQPWPAAVHQQCRFSLLLVQLPAAVELPGLDSDGLARARTGSGPTGFDRRG